MRWSRAFIPTLKEVPAEAEAVSHKLMLKAGLIKKLSSGVYSYLPLGWRVLVRVEQVIRQEMNRMGAQEVLLPALQPAELWKESGRYDLLGQDMIKFKNRHGAEQVLGPTHEEVITDLVRGHLTSWRQLPVTLYQIQTKFRDELRPRFGVIRSREFTMKDAYSFDRDDAACRASYQKAADAYDRVFQRLGFRCFKVEADTGIMGGSLSHEYLAPSPFGEDWMAVCPCGHAVSVAPEFSKEKPDCPRCQKPVQPQPAIELGHIFALGTRYSQKMGLQYSDESGKPHDVVMGCYGIGVTRIIPTAIEQHHDDNGIIWPAEMAPYPVHVIGVNMDDAGTREAVDRLEVALEQSGWDVLIDDRPDRAGVKFKDADLIGLPVRIVISERTLANGQAEIKRRDSQQIEMVALDQVPSRVQASLKTCLTSS